MHHPATLSVSRLTLRAHRRTDHLHAVLPRSPPCALGTVACAAAQREKQFAELLALEKERQRHEMTDAKALLEAGLDAREQAKQDAIAAAQRLAKEEVIA